MALLTSDQLRAEINAVAVRAADCDLKERVLRELRRSVDSGSTHRTRRRKAAVLVQAWAESHLLPAFERVVDLPGIAAFAAFTVRHPEVRKGDRPMGPTVFYRALEASGYTIHRQGAYVTLPGVELT